MANKTAGWIQVVLGILTIIWVATPLKTTMNWGFWVFGILVAIVGLWEAFGK